MCICLQLQFFPSGAFQCKTEAYSDYSDCYAFPHGFTFCKASNIVVLTDYDETFCVFDATTFRFIKKIVVADFDTSGKEECLVIVVVVVVVVVMVVCWCW